MSAIQPYTLITGEVLLWGEYVHVHSRGYRAEWAKPSAFYMTDGMTDRLKTVIGLAALQWDTPVVRADAPETEHRYEQSLQMMSALRDCERDDTKVIAYGGGGHSSNLILGEPMHVSHRGTDLTQCVVGVGIDFAFDQPSRHTTHFRQRAS